MGFRIFSYVWFLLFLSFGILILRATPEQIEKDKAFIENEIKPNVIYIDSFKKISKKLPSDIEFYTWRGEQYLKHYPDQKALIDSQIKQDLIWQLGVEYLHRGNSIPYELKPTHANIDWGNNYVISVLRDNQFEYYTSCNKRYLGNNSSWSGSYIGFAESLLIGVLPFLFVSFKRMIKKYKNMRRK